MKNYLLIAIIICFGASLQAQNYTGKQKDIDQILQNIASFSQAVMNGENDKIAAAYTVDGKIFPNRREILEGTESLAQYWKPNPEYKVVHHKVTPTELTIVKKTAYDYGYYEGKTLLPDGTTSAWKGKYVIVWKKVGKEWKIYLDIWNDLPKE